MFPCPSSAVRRQQRHIERHGADTVFAEKTVRAVVEEVADSKVGTRALPQAQLGVYIAASDAHVFIYSAAQFVPYTTLPVPTEKLTILWHGREYLITHVTFQDEGDDTILILCYAYRPLL